MIRWIPYTFVRTVLFFIGGILLGLYAPDLIPEMFSAILAVLLTGCYLFLVLYKRIRDVVNPGWIALPAVFLLGYVHLVNQTESRGVNHLIHNDDPVSHYKAVMTRFAEERERTWKLEARVLEIRIDRWQRKEGKVILYFSKEDFPKPFEYGDVLVIKGQPQRPDLPANPGEFDYRGFLALRNIYHQHFIRGNDVIKVDHAPPSQVLAFAFQGRAWAEKTLNRFVEGPREQALASALVLGVTDGLDNELLNAYAATGSMHILAVSGLHISILYFVLLWILKPLNRVPGGKWIVVCTALLLLWMYAFITGLSPSVLRAVAMFSFLAIARPWARSTNIYNTLAISAFCLLLFDPFLVRAVGFQLSYLAVLGIVYLYPRIIVLWEPDHWIATEVWKLSAVSIAAQIATFPLGLLYFHQFPNYFLLSNLLVVPLSSIVLIFGLIVLGVNFVSVIAIAVGFCLQMIIRFLNAVVFTLEGFPFSLIDNVYISAWQCAVLVVFIVLVLALMEYRRFHYFVLACALMVLYTGLQWLHFFSEVQVHKIAVYNVPGHSGIDLISRAQAWFLADSALTGDPEKIRYHVDPHRLMAGVRHVTQDVAPARPLKGCRVIIWNGKTILQITDRDFDFPGPLAVDWLIVGNNALADVTILADRLTFRKVVLDSSNSFFFASRFLEAAKLHKLEIHSVLHQGAFIAKIENQDT
jgi:competence protein ComEC